MQRNEPLNDIVQVSLSRAPRVDLPFSPVYPALVASWGDSFSSGSCVC
jgi:hypothetical protein